MKLNIFLNRVHMQNLILNQVYNQDWNRLLKFDSDLASPIYLNIQNGPISFYIKTVLCNNLTAFFLKLHNL